VSAVIQLLQNALYGTALILTAALLRRILAHRLIPEARLVLWALCLLRLLAPAAPGSALSLWGLLAGPAPQPAQTPQVSSPVQTVPAAPAPAPQPAAPAFPWEMVLAAVWLAGGLALALRYILSWRRTRRAVECAIPIPRPDPRYFPLPKCARLREGVVDGAPLTFGTVRPTVVLIPGLSGAELDCVLAHEGVHARRGDNVWHYVMALALTVYWWNPAVWLMARLLRRDIELSCDRAAVQGLGLDRRADYARALVSLATQGEGSAFSRPFGQKLTEERIIMIMNYKKPALLSTVLTLLLVLSLSVALGTSPAAAAPATEPAPVVSDPAENTEPALPKEELLLAELDQFIASLDPEIKLALGYKLEYPVAQANCTHPNINQAKVETWSWRTQGDASGHEFYEQSIRVCPDCGTRITYGPTSLVRKEPHKYTAGTYVGSNHLAANPSLHYLIFNHACSVCNYNCNYNVNADCTKSDCVNFNSVTPEPEVIHALRTPSGTYALCGARSCLVPYDHYHLDGKIVRVYYENPGLLCGRDSCCAEGPHTHDGLQFVDKAPEAYIVLHKMSTDETDGMIEDCFQALAALDTAAP